MPLIINEVVSDVRITRGSGETSATHSTEGNPDRDKAERLLERIRRDQRRLSGRDEDDTREVNP